jgi:hypothetical protein
MLGYGTDIVTARKLAYLGLDTFTSGSNTASPAVRFGVGLGCPSVRILGIHLAASAVPESDGTMLLNAFVYDASEAADDTLVDEANMETLITAANTFYEISSYEDDDSSDEQIFTLDPGDTLRFTLVSNNTINTNPNFTALIEYFNIARRQSNESEPSYVGYPSQMASFTQG